jgi:Flp pilus assembly protein TadG
MRHALRLARSLLHREDGAAAAEAAFLLPVFLTLTLGTVDLGAAMFEMMQMSSAAQAGMASAVLNPSLSGVPAALNAGAGGFALNTGLSAATITSGVITVRATCDTGSGAACAPILPWDMGNFIHGAFPAHHTATIIVRVQ